MFSKLFGGKKESVLNTAEKKAALLDAAIEKARETNPVAHLQIGADELVQMLIDDMKTEKGVHIETLLGGLGSLGGFCCVDSTVKQAAALGRTTQECGIVDVETADGNHYYFGDPINSLLLEGDRSLCALVAGIINKLGSQEYPDAADIAGHVAGTVGGPDFGHPRVPDQHRPAELPIDYVRNLWPIILPLIERRVPILRERVVLFGLAIQKVIEMGKDAIPPAIAGKLVMECAVPMAKLDPAKLWA